MSCKIICHHSSYHPWCILHMYEPCGYQGGAASYTSSMKENDSRVMHAQSTEAAKNKNQRFNLCSPSDGLLLPSQIPAGNEVAFFVLRCQSITSQSPHENLPSKKKAGSFCLCRIPFVPAAHPGNSKLGHHDDSDTGPHGNLHL